VPIYEAGRWRSTSEPFYAMKLVEGRTLKEALVEAPHLAARLALLPNVLAVAEAVAFAHTHRIIHRDLKPANVLLGPFGETIVADWGLAKDLDEGQGEHAPVGEPTARPPADDSRTVEGSVLGTPGYMAPEQARGDDADERSDVYALGATLYHLLAGKARFAGRTSRGRTVRG
jgi:serine/threonine protein kinase